MCSGLCAKYMLLIHRLIHTQNAHTPYQSAVVWHAQSSGVRVKEVWPHFDEYLPMFMLTITYHEKTCMAHGYITCPCIDMLLGQY